jgi:hypothetical protein
VKITLSRLFLKLQIAVEHKVYLCNKCTTIA